VLCVCVCMCVREPVPARSLWRAARNSATCVCVYVHALTGAHALFPLQPLRKNTYGCSGCNGSDVRIDRVPSPFLN